MSQIQEALFGPQHWFGAFLARSDEKDIAANHVGETSKRMAQGLRDSGVSVQKPVILDVGCGEGGFTCELLKAIRPYFADARFVGIDPSSTMIDSFREKLQKEGLWDPQSMVLITDCFFDHASGQPPQKAFQFGKADLLWANHACYYTENPPRTIGEFCDALSPNGVASVLLQSGDSETHQLNALFGNPNAAPRWEGHPVCSNHLVGCLKKAGQNLPQVSFESHLFFSEGYADHFDRLGKECLEKNLPRERWKGILSEEFLTDICALEFILRTPFHEMEIERARECLRRAKEMIGNNLKKGAKSPRLLQKESICFAGGSDQVRGIICDVVNQYNQEQNTVKILLDARKELLREKLFKKSCKSYRSWLSFSPYEKNPPL